MDESLPNEVVLRLPDWVSGFVAGRVEVGEGDEERMGLAVELSRENVQRGTGGPFGAAVFDDNTGALLSVGVNVVTSMDCSVAHAEIVALALAQKRLDTFDLAAAESVSCALYSSAEPCAMCMGAIPWSGVRRLVCAARVEDVCAIGFDEGSKPEDWVSQLERRGITVTRDVGRDEAVKVLQEYGTTGGKIYNPSR